MAKLVSFLVCDSVSSTQVAPGVAVQHLVGPQVALRPPFIPATFSFGLAVGFTDINPDIGGKFRFTIADPNGTIIQDSGENPFPAIVEQGTMPKEYQGFMANVDVRNLIINFEGIYRFSFYVDGECIGTKEVPFFKAVN